MLAGPDVYAVSSLPSRLSAFQIYGDVDYSRSYGDEVHDDMGCG
jgi:hypothetical protein